MEKSLLYFLLIFSFTFCKVHPTYAQTNLVPNPSFEQYSNCPHIYCGISYATGWHSAGYTPDYYNSCDSPNGAYEWGTPSNAYGYQYPASGNAYAGIATYGSIIREYLSAELITPLEPGEKYFVSFKVSRVDRLVYCANNMIGALFSTIIYNLGNDSCNDVQGLLPHNFAHIYSTQIITDTSNWTNISGSFVADSAYQYIIIGNHFDDNNTDTINGDPNVVTGYYFIDDIYVSTDSINGITQNNLEHSVTVYPTITNDILFVQINTQAKASIKIYDLLGKLIVSQNVLSLTQNRISIQEYDAGLYIVRVDIDNKIITKKIIVTK